MRKNAYLTVEAVLVMPVVLGVIILTIYLLFFQYDRCVMEQNMGVLAMRGCTLQAENQEELVEKLYCKSEQIDTRKFLAWDIEPAGITLQGNRITVEQTGYLKFPFQRMAFWNGSDRWGTTAKYRNQRIQPMIFIRNCRRVMGGK